MKYLFLDTNIYLHYMDFEQIQWKEVIGTNDDFTIVVVPTVQEEIDKRKDSSRGKIQKKAKKISSKLYGILMRKESCRWPVVRCRTLVPSALDRENFDLERADNRIILSALKSGFPIDDIYIISGDQNIQFSAVDNGLHNIMMPEDYRLPDEPTEEEKQLRALQEELNRMRNTYSKPVIEFEDDSVVKSFVVPKEENSEALLLAKMDEIKAEVCEVNESNYSTIFNQDIGYFLSRQADPDKMAKYNNDREAYLDEEYEYQKLLIEKRLLDARFKKISFKISNVGTAPTGYMMLFIDVPKNVKIYTREGSRIRVNYKAPVKPSSSLLPMDRETLRTMILMQNMGSASSVWLWDPEKNIKNMEFKEASTSIIQNLCRPLETSFYIDIRTTESFEIRWSIADENLPDMAKGVLKVEINSNM